MTRPLFGDILKRGIRIYIVSTPGEFEPRGDLFPATGCSLLSRACGPHNDLTDPPAKGRGVKRCDLSAIHPEQGRLVRAHGPFRQVASFGSFLRHGVEICDPIKSVTRLGLEDLHRARRRQAPFCVRESTRSDQLTCCPQRPRAYLGSCIGTGKRLDQPVRDAGRGAGLLIFLSSYDDHGQSMLVIVRLPTDRAAHVHAVDTRGVVLEYRQRRAVVRNQRSRLVDVRHESGAKALGSHGLGKGCRLKRLIVLASFCPVSQFLIVYFDYCNERQQGRV